VLRARPLPFAPPSAAPSDPSNGRAALQTGGRVAAPPAQAAHQVPPELAGTAWGQLVSATPARTDVGRVRNIGKANRGIAPGFFQGGPLPPTAADLTPDMQARLYATGGIGESLSEKDGAKLQAAGWSYGLPAPEGYHYDSSGVLTKKMSSLKEFGRGLAQHGAIMATAATAGAASPLVAASVGGGTALAAAKAQGASWKQALIAGALGAAGGGVGAAPLNTGTRIAAQTGLGAAGGALNGGGARGALLGAASAGVSAASPQITQAITPQGAGAAQQAITAAGVQAAIGGAFGGPQGAVQAGGTALLNSTLTSRARAAQQRRNAYLSQQRP
jgi:hypothetical protein